MLTHLKKFTVQLLTGANVATVLLMLLVGYSDRIYPATHPLVSIVGMTFPFFLAVNMVFLLMWLLLKWTRAWIPVVGCLLAYVPISIYMPLHPSQQVPEGAIKLLSYNVCAYSGNSKYDEGFETIRDYLSQQQPDIVCLQEDCDSWRRIVFKDYKKCFAYNDTMTLVNTEKCFNCLGIHTRFPILRRERIHYESMNNGSAAWWLNVDGDTVIVVNNHFESCHLNEHDRTQYRQILRGEMVGDSARTESKLLMIKLAEANAKRCVQIDAVRRYIQDHLRYPIIVCGDFNDNPISYSRRTMSKGLRDCFVETGRGLGLSYNQKAFLLRIDHIFCTPDIEPYNCQVDEKMDASDHNPIICWLKIGGNH